MRTHQRGSRDISVACWRLAVPLMNSSSCSCVTSGTTKHRKHKSNNLFLPLWLHLMARMYFRVFSYLVSLLLVTYLKQHDWLISMFTLQSSGMSGTEFLLPKLWFVTSSEANTILTGRGREAGEVGRPLQTAPVKCQRCQVTPTQEAGEHTVHASNITNTPQDSRHLFLS